MVADDGDDFFPLLIRWGRGLPDNTPKYEHLNINRNAICCSATNTHRDRGNKGNG